MQDRSLEVLTRKSSLSEHFITRQAPHVVVRAIKPNMNFEFGFVRS